MLILIRHVIMIAAVVYVIAGCDFCSSLRGFWELALLVALCEKPFCILHRHQQHHKEQHQPQQNNNNNNNNDRHCKSFWISSITRSSISSSKTTTKTITTISMIANHTSRVQNVPCRLIFAIGVPKTIAIASAYGCFTGVDCFPMIDANEANPSML